MIVDMKNGPDLADYLAHALDDLTFELLLRKRIMRNVELTLDVCPNIPESHITVRFEFAQCDQSKWRVEMGTTYSDMHTIRGEVLSVTFRNSRSHYEAQQGNKLSLLLPAPEPDVQGPLGGDAVQTDEDFKW